MPKLIALDAGHGVDTLGKGVPGLREHDFNAAVVKVAKDLLEANGFDVLLTQPLNCPEVRLSDRTNLSNSKGADILLSFHADANGNPDARGHWAFYWYSSEAGRNLANLWSEEIVNLTGTKHRGNRESKTGEWTNFHMVRETAMPAVLMEHGFMTNEADLLILKSEHFRQKFGEAAARAVCRYFGVEYNKPVKRPEALADWAIESYDWAVSEGITDGSRPKDSVTREEVWTMLHRLSKK